MTHDERRESILAAGVKASEKIGYLTVTRVDIAKVAGVSPALVQYHFNTMDELRERLIKKAIETENVRVLAQAMGVLDPSTAEAPQELKRKALNFINTEAVA